MAQRTLSVRQKQKYDTSTNWATNNPVLLAGEIGIESDTHKMKAGDGVTAWNSLGYISIPYTETDPTVPSWAKQANKPTYDYSEISNTPTIPTQVTSVNGLSGGTISSDVTVSGNVYANYLEGTWLKSTDATDTGSWTDVWVNSGGWLYKRSKENFKSDLNIPDTSNFVTTNTKQTIEARKKFYLSGSNTPLVVKTALAQAFIEFQDSNNSTMGSLGVNESKKPVFFDNYEHELAYASDIPTKLSQLSQDASYRTVTDTEKTTWNGKNGATTYNLVNDSGQAATSGYVRKRIANINGQYLTFHKQYSSTSPQTFSGGPFTNVLLAWVEQASTSDTQSQRTTLKSVDNSKWSINGNYKHWICVIGFTN